MKVLKVLGVIVVALIALDRLVMCGAGPDGMNYQRRADEAREELCSRWPDEPECR